MSRAYPASSRLLGALLIVLGVAILVTTIANGGGPLALGVFLGVLFVALGAARVRLARALSRS